MRLQPAVQILQRIPHFGGGFRIGGSLHQRLDLGQQRLLVVGQGVGGDAVQPGHQFGGTGAKLRQLLVRKLRQGQPLAVGQKQRQHSLRVGRRGDALRNAVGCQIGDQLVHLGGIGTQGIGKLLHAVPVGRLVFVQLRLGGIQLLLALLPLRIGLQPLPQRIVQLRLPVQHLVGAVFQLRLAVVVLAPAVCQLVLAVLQLFSAVRKLGCGIVQLGVGVRLRLIVLLPRIVQLGAGIRQQAVIAGLAAGVLYSGKVVCHRLHGLAVGVGQAVLRLGTGGGQVNFGVCFIGKGFGLQVHDHLHRAAAHAGRLALIAEIIAAVYQPHHSKPGAVQLAVQIHVFGGHGKNRTHRVGGVQPGGAHLHQTFVRALGHPPFGQHQPVDGIVRIGRQAVGARHGAVVPGLHQQIGRIGGLHILHAGHLLQRLHILVSQP